jgi:hypothetical protein
VIIMQNVDPMEDPRPRPEATRDPEVAERGPGKQIGLLYLAIVIVVGLALIIYFVVR